MYVSTVLDHSAIFQPGRYLDLGTGKKLLNLGTHSYLNLGERPEIEEAALQCLHKYGVGSCGPRGFYGTTRKLFNVDKISISIVFSLLISPQETYANGT